MRFALTSEYVADPVPLTSSEERELLPWDFLPYRDISTADSS